MISLTDLINSIRLSPFHGKRAEFYEDLAKSTNMKELLPDFLEAEIAIATAKQTRDSSKAFALKGMLKVVRDGHDFSLANSVGRMMPKSDSMLLAAVDQAKKEQKVETLIALAEAIKQQSAAKALMIKALVVPAILVPFVAAFAYILSTQSLPIIEKIAPPQVWTPFNNSVRVFAHFVDQYGAMSLGLFLLISAVFIYQLPRWRSPVRYKMERVSPKLAVLLTPIAPWLLPLSMYRDFQVGMVLTALAVLLQTGRTLKEALETVRANSSPYMRKHIARILYHIDEHPTEYQKAFSKGFLSPRLLARLSSLLRNEKDFDKVIINIGTVGNVEIQEQVRQSSSKINTMFLLIASSVLVFLYLGQQSIGFSLQEELDPHKRTQRKMEQTQNRIR